jgi:FKBP-type peptidyl-prolyl cis-trans isomerase
MAKKPNSFLGSLTQTQKVAIGGGLVGLLLTIAIFVPGGFLDQITRPSDTESSTESPNLLTHDDQETEQVPAEMSPEKNEEYLAANAKKAGVKVTASGLQYRELTAGTGKQPGPTSTVTVHYKGTFINGKQFDSSYDRGQPISFPLDGVIKGWTEGLQLMKEGGKIELVIPQDLAYGAGRPGIPPYQTLVFQVELIKVN